MAQGYIGNGTSSSIRFLDPQSINLQLGTNDYPNGTITFDNIGASAAYWANNHSSRTSSVNMYLCDSTGGNRVFLFTISLAGGATNTTIKSATISGATGLAGKALYLVATANGVYEDDNKYVQLRRQTTVTVATASLSHTVTCSAGTGGTLTASVSSAVPGATVTLYPNPATGYQLASYSSNPSVTITNNKFTMPSSNVTITATFDKITYSITKSVNPSGAGTVTTSVNNAQIGTSVTVSQTPATGYSFKDWTTTPASLISNGAFTMPAQNVSITANYRHRSSCSLNKTSLEGGGSAILTITTESTAYSHKYKLSFGTGMDSGWVSVAAGTTSVTISVPLSWSTAIPSASSKTGGTLTLQTYNGTSQVGNDYTISSLTYTVPTSVMPTLGTITKSIARTVGGTTYANIGEYYVQSHCGVRVQATAGGAQGSTISSMTVSIAGYSGSSYTQTSTGGSLDKTSGLLYTSGTTSITVTATDSRGRTVSKTETITVTAYSPPTGSLIIRRVDASGNDDESGTYAKFTLTSQFSAIGSNSLTRTMTSRGSTVTLSADSGDILPGSRQTFDIQQEYPVTVTLADAFETVTITSAVRSARFIIYVNGAGDKLGFMKATTKSTPTGKSGTIEFSGDYQIYIGDSTLEDYIRSIVNNM